MKTVSLLSCLCFVFSVSCATNQKSRLATTAVGIGLGAAIGAGTAPNDERPELHALYWGGILGVVSAVAANYYFNDERDLEVMRLENEKLKAELDLFQNGPSTLLKDEARNKARVKLYKIDQWVSDGPNRRYHRDQMMEILPLEKGQ
ncbi:MAG: hypothetical protein KUL82_00115 [Bdellovibrio sp.]|nr:hypothetical protein [Bdellovibrio sp.]